MARLAGRSTQNSDQTAPSADAGRLFLWFPVGLATRKVSRYLRQIERSFATTSTGALAVDAPGGYPERLVLDLAALLSEHEASDTRCVYKPGDDDLDVEDIDRVRTIQELRHFQSSAWLVEMMRGERLRSVFQPIVHANQPSLLLGHEALLRGVGHDGRAMSPVRMFDAARTCGMTAELDFHAHRVAIRAAAMHQDRRQLFLNFTPDSIRVGLRCLEPTIRALDDALIPRSAVVLEVIDAERTTDLRHLRRVLTIVRDAGLRVALDDVGCGERSRRLIHEIRPDYVKLDMSEVRRFAGGPSVRDAERMLELAQSLRIETIAESVETDEELDWNQQFGATYVQGYYIGRPAALSA
jgi:EAL domain-containing protein (putative c-di-GMP-specific phosphodiesterase class I)